MSGAKVSTIRASLGPLQHLRQQPPAPSTPGMQIPAYPDTQAPVSVPAVSRHSVGKRSDPRYGQLKAYVTRTSKRAAMKRAEAEGYRDFSDLVQKLIDDYVGR